MWNGVEFENEGQSLRLAATEPLCGCLKVTNISQDMIRIRSSMQDRTLGTLDLKKGESTAANFDWAGPRGEDTFHLDTWSTDGKLLKAQEVLRVDDTGWPWFPCVGHIPGQPPPPICPIGALKLSTGRSQQ